MSALPARLSTRAIALGAAAALGAGLLTAAATPAAATGPTLSRTSVVYIADTNGDFGYGIYAASVSNPTVRTAILPESDTVDVDDAKVSPDGTKVAALVDRVGLGDYSLEVIDVATGNHTTIATATSNSDFSVQTLYVGFDWSRDGSTLVYSQDAYNAASSPTDTYTLYTRPADASSAATALTGGARLAYPAYSQDGTKIVASDLFGANPGLYVLPVAGGSTTRIATPPSGKWFTAPTWSVDGTTIVASLTTPSVNGSGGHADIVGLDPNGASTQTPTAITPTGNTHLAYLRPAFSMDGSLWFDAFDVNACCSGDLYQARRNSTGGWTMTNRTSTKTVDEGTASLPRPVDDGAPANPVTLGTVGLTNTSLTVNWSVPAGLDDYADVTLHRTDLGDSSEAVINHAYGTSYVDKNVVAGHTYVYSATVNDGSGNAGPISGEVNATVAGVKLVVVTPTSTTQHALPFKVTWGLPGQTGVTYDVVYATKGGSSWALGAPHAWLTGTSASSATFPSPVAGQTYYFKATVHDTHGNSGATSYAGVNVPLDQRSATFSRNWVTVKNATAYWLGSVASTAVSGSTATVVVTSKSVQIIGTKCTTCGSMTIYVDGHKKTTVSTKATSTKVRQALWSGSFSAIGRHTIKVVAVLARGQKLQIDGFADPR